MDLQSGVGGQGENGPLDALLRHALLLDLEVSHSGKILKLGAVFREAKLALPGGTSSEALTQHLAQLAPSAECVLGHNLIGHDLPILREKAPSLPVHQLPVIDTLILSPICFPENPYHRLVKDYKLVRESLNDPVADARQAASLFSDEFRSLEGLRQTETRVFDLLHFLLAAPESANDQCARGMSLLFHSLGAGKPNQQHALSLCRDLLPQWGCGSFRVDESLLQTRAQRFALAYAITWLRVSGLLNSVLPPWVRLQHPLTGELIRKLREVPCSSSGCTYCRTVHNSREQLRRFFQFPDFRARPTSITGGSLQQDIVEAGMRNESLLAILPTSGGKSLCFQLPALVRNFRRGVLTVVISPLQALMKDQVDGLVRRTETTAAAALYGLLTPPERSDVLRAIRLGDVAILYVSPEQLRNRTFRDAIAQREIGCWVFDEAHCLSKWGHDFRPDYLYAGRFIRDFSKKQGVDIPPIACFTATAKQDVIDEILAFFRTETGRELKLFLGGVERENLLFEVRAIGDPTKLQEVQHLLSERLPPGQDGSAIIFRATRNDAELTAEFLRSHGWAADHFHAGLLAPEKKQVQDQFLAGNTRVICATNAFGMGIDKDDVRLVIHADTPGSLENYLQEAGRAGRDGQSAECVLLYADADCERQFRMEAFSELSRRDIAQILRTLRKASRGNNQEIVITTGEILRDEELQVDIDAQDRTSDTKIRTAISWLERANLLQRDENVTNVFQARPLVKDIEEARQKMRTLNLSESETALWLAILRQVFGARPDQGLLVDDLALLPEFSTYAKANPKALANPEFLGSKILSILGSMARVGLMKRDVLLTAYLRYKVADHSLLRLQHILSLDRKLLDVLAIEEPDPEGWMPLSIRSVNQRLRDEGLDSSPEIVRALLKSLSQDGRAPGRGRGSIELRYLGKDSLRVRVLRQNWTAINELAEKRRRVASLLLDTLFAKIPPEAKPSAEFLLEFHFDELHRALEQDLFLRNDLKDIDAAIERALLFMHEQRVIVLQHGLAIFRSAMTIRFQEQNRREKYKASDYEPLEHHYKERVLQVHVMSEYARLGIQRIQAALELVLAYFKLPKQEFLRRFFPTKPELLQRATTARSFQKIVTDLANQDQQNVVTAPTSRNMLILAGPGSGKTRTVVHRCAYLLRVERVRPHSILICCFNRHAAIQLRSRLSDLVGDDARGVTVLTYHALAMRLLGYSYSGQAEKPRDIDFDALISDATRLLRGEHVPPGLEADELRDRLLAGFQHILVDEYQDIDHAQYELISALAGRTLDDPDLKLSILAVGDDDQNIYAFRGANVQFIQRFQQDYDADVHYLVENYRSTRCIIETTNAVIAVNRDRMKITYPIRIDSHRQMLPAGGEFAARDPLFMGQVQLVQVPDAWSQAHAVIAELRRLRQLGVTSWSAIAVLSREHADLAQIRTLAERESIPIRWMAARNAMPALNHIREIHRFLNWLSTERASFKNATQLLAAVAELSRQDPPSPWTEFLKRTLEAWRTESADAELPVQDALEFLYEACAESRREFTYGEGVTLCTVHSAKGTEFDHVMVIGPWRLDHKKTDQEEERRTFYVGLTRARKTLAVFDRQDIGPSLPETLPENGVVRYPSTADPTPRNDGLLNYCVLSLEDINLGYAGLYHQNSRIHTILAALKPGDQLTMGSAGENGIGLFHSNFCVARLSRKAEAEWNSCLPAIREIRVLAMIRRTAAQDTDQHCREKYKVQEWEVPLVEVIFTDSQLAEMAD